MQTLLNRLRFLIFTQRFVRMLFRAVWLGGAAYLIGWGINQVYGPTFDSKSLILLGVVFALPALVAAFLPMPLPRLVWALDRRLGLREQVSAAWQAANEGGQNQLTGQLVEDVAGLLPAQQARILRFGWFIQRGVVSLLIIIILFATVLWERRTTETAQLPEAASLELPPIPEETTAGDVFPSGIPGLVGDPGETSTGEQGSSGSSGGQFALEDLGALQGILNDLGADLSDQPETFDAGRALQQGDLDGGAQAIEQLADQADLLSEAARNNLQQALQSAANQAQDAGEDGLAEDLEKAASSLDILSPDTPLAADALDELADDLRDLAKLVASAGGDENASPIDDGLKQTGGTGGGEGAGTGASTSAEIFGNEEPFDRFEEEGETFDFEGGNEPSGLLQPGAPTGDGPIVSGAGTVDGLAPAIRITNGVLIPYHYSWEWRDVVSEYFTPE